MRLHFFSFLLLLSLPRLHASPYLSSRAFFTNCDRMIKSLRIFTYAPASHAAHAFPSATETLFFSQLQNSTFLTHDPEEAHLFFIPIPFSALSTHTISNIRQSFPYWNRTLGADHFFISCSGVSRASDRNILELKKNSILISCFPSRPANSFVPHKDITFPPLLESQQPPNSLDVSSSGMYLAYVRPGWVRDASLMETLNSDADILAEAELSDVETYEERLSRSKFCVFEYPDGEVWRIGDVGRKGCIPFVITAHPILDLPLMEVMRWEAMAMFMRPGPGGGIPEEGKRAMKDAIGNGRYKEMRRLWKTAKKHMDWSSEPQPYDAFHMVMYQLWLRRHTVRYLQRPSPTAVVGAPLSHQLFDNYH